MRKTTRQRVEAAITQIPTEYAYDDFGFPSWMDHATTVIRDGRVDEATKVLALIVDHGDTDTLRALRSGVACRPRRVELINDGLAHAVEQNRLVLERLAQQQAVA